MKKARLINFGLSLVFLFLLMVLIPNLSHSIVRAQTTTPAASTPTTTSGTLNIGNTIPTCDEVFQSCTSGTGGIFSSPESIISFAFRIIIAISGAIFIVLLLIGGLTYLTSAGNEDGTSKAKKMLIDAVIGLIIVLSSFAIGSYVLGQLGLSSSAGSNGTVGTGTPTNNNPSQLPTNQPTHINFQIKGVNSDNYTFWLDSFKMQVGDQPVTQLGPRNVYVRPINNSSQITCSQAVNLTPSTQRITATLTNTSGVVGCTISLN
jgi:hypothetical protein